MKITVWGINYAPELTGIAPYNTELCEFLSHQGHDVEMVTTFAYYPSWRKSAEDFGAAFRTDVRAGVKIRRCWHFVPSEVRAWKRIVHEGSFVLFSFFRLLGMERPDVLVVVSPPLLLGAAAWLVGCLKGTRFVFHVQDLQPDAATGLGMIQQGAFLKLLYRIELFAYRKAALVSAISFGIIEAIAKKGIASEKIIYFPNGVRLPETKSLPKRGCFRKAHRLEADEFLVVYSGNLGMKQGLEVALHAASLLTQRNIRLVICGDGAHRGKLTELLCELNLTNVLMLPIQPETAYREMLVDADLCLITQQAGSGSFFFPSKLLSVLAFAKPVVCVSDGDSELAAMASQYHFGINVPPQEPELLAICIQELAGDAAALSRMAQAGLGFVKRFDMEEVLSEFERRLQSFARN
ncbi:MAG: WcaI family glycosyltransferase [Bryobacteraceae bacterium]|nr:WcaI family glycosyltransferase [Bryobacteraceae bacterium]